MVRISSINALNSPKDWLLCITSIWDVTVHNVPFRLLILVY